ncbi:MAG: hypothetical protein ABL949_06750 [Fimbriimonadaceae bacterium]
MSSPPPFVPPMAPYPQKKNNNTVLIVVLILVVLVPCIGILVFGALGLSFFKNTAMPMATCMITFEGAKSAVEEYTADKGHLPNAATWQDDVRSYYKKYLESKKEDFGPFSPPPADGVWSCKSGTTVTGLAFNDDVSGKKMADIKDKSTTVLLYEVDKAEMNAHAKYVKKPDSAAPMIFGKSRGWITVTVDGDVKMKDSAHINID